jgi:signal transduction histidine kinase
MLDITASRGIEAALRERAEALEEADKLKNAFVSNMSYELRVPLTSIAGFAEMLGGGYAGDLSGSAKEYVDAINVSVTRLSSVIENLLDITQSETGSLPMAAEPVDVVRIAAAAAEEAQMAADEKNITFVAQIDPKLGEVVGDERRLRQALDHLLRNAIIYTPSGGRVLMRASGDNMAVRVVISDNGIGMSPHDRERIFNRFARNIPGYDPSDEAKQKLGLGLPLSRQLVEAHGGELTLASELGQGTTITIILPRSGPATQPPRTEDQVLRQPASRKKGAVRSGQ